jgi:hypothetical protein
MLDYLLSFPNEAAAQADSVVGAFWMPPDNQGDPGSWRGDVCIPSVAVTVISTGQPYNANWNIIISQSADNPLLDGHANLVLAANRDMANAGAPPSQFVLSSVVPAAEWPLLQVSPQFAGSNYPFGQSA